MRLLGCKYFTAIVLLTIIPLKSVKFGFSLRLNKALFLPVVATSLSGSIAIAQIPSYDEYNVGSGSVVKVSTTPAETKLKPFKIEDLRSGSLDREVRRSLEELVRMRGWDAVIAKVKLLNLVNDEYFGNKRYLIETFNLDNSDLEKVEGARASLSFNLRQLSDFALANRVLFFNKEDMKQVADMASDSGKEFVEGDVSEAVELVRASQEAMDELKSSLHI